MSDTGKIVTTGTSMNTTTQQQQQQRQQSTHRRSSGGSTRGVPINATSPSRLSPVSTSITMSCTPILLSVPSSICDPHNSSSTSQPRRHSWICGTA